jgi:hypothetical protein
MTLATVTTRTRMMVQDVGFPFAANIAVDGVSTIFDLPVEAISAIVTPPLVIFNGAIISGQATPSYVIDYKYGTIQFFTPPSPAGGILSVQGITYNYYDDDEVLQAITDAFNLHVADQDPLPVLSNTPPLGSTVLPSQEEYLVSILATIELLWYQATDTSQQVDIHTPEGVDIPRAQRFQQITQQIAGLKAEYNQISAALGVGLYRIQVLNQRRVSMTTNRLVPIFREQEYNQPYTGFWPTAALPGSLVTIYGKWFTYTSDVTFGGTSVAGNFTVVSDTELQAIVPTGAITGQIIVITPYGVVPSTAQFVVGEPAPFILYGPELVKIPIPPGS